MKHQIFFALTVTGAINIFNADAQNINVVHNPADSVAAIYKIPAINDQSVLTYHINLSKTTHIISPEDILYVDISSPNVDGDLSEKNICRIKPSKGAFVPGQNFQVTVVTESFIAVYKLVCTAEDDPENAVVITIDPDKAFQTNTYGKIGKQEFYQLSTMALNKRRKIFNVQSKEFGMELWVNNIFVIGDFLLVDVTAKNRTRLQYNIDAVRFHLQDKNNVNAHVSQEIELHPLYEFYGPDNAVIKNRWRNFFIFRKFTYPGEKVFNIELTEKQISGRKIEVNVDYNQVLHSDYLL